MILPETLFRASRNCVTRTKALSLLTIAIFCTALSAVFPSASGPGLRISVMVAVNSSSGLHFSYSAIFSMMCRC